MDEQDENHNIIPGAWRNDAVLPEVHLTASNRLDLQTGKKVRDTLKQYFGSEAGRVPWQDKFVNVS